MTEMVDKVVVTNRAALAAKYGDAVDQILQAVDAMLEANQAHGLSAVLIEIDDAAAMQEYGATVVDAADAGQCKAAIDGIYQALAPDYLMILGATDVIPHVPLKNPMYTGPDGGDPDEIAYGDLPYACDAPYGEDPAAFLGPTRVVGRLPDIVGSSDPAYLVGLLANATEWRTGSREDYASYLGMTAKVWTGSTTLSLQSVFGDATDLKTTPSDGPNWPADLLGRRSHFINCHGADSDDHFYGQEGNSFPVAHDGKLIDGQITAGTVVAAECCYGAQLYDPTGIGGPGICHVYLGSGAFGFWGSSTIAYGPADANGSADYMCQFFLDSTLTGASLGRAALEARQRFVQQVTTVDPADLKTLAQYSLLGDPSIHPVRAAHDVVAVPSAAEPKGLPLGAIALSAGRAARRANLAAIGLALLRSAAVAVEVMEEVAPAAGSILDQLRSLAEEPALEGAVVKTFQVSPPSISAEMHAMVAPQPETLHLAVARSDEETGPRRIVAVIGRERDGQIVEFRKLYGK